MDIGDAIARLRIENEPVPRPMRLPTAIEVEGAEKALAMQFPADYRRFLLEAGDVVFGTYEPFDLSSAESPTALVSSVQDAWALGVSKQLLPFCEDNGNYFCLTPKGSVVYWDHNGQTDEVWPDLATWISDVWLEAA